MKDKIFILGGRSGTSLVHNCLLATKQFKNWGKVNREAPFQELTFKYYPNIPEEYYIDDFNLAKCPSFDLVLDKIIEKYHPKFIILERRVEERAQSRIRLNWHKLGLRRVRNENKKLFVAVGKTNDPVKFAHSWSRFSDQQREKFLKGYDENKILRIHFNDLMDNFEENMRKIAKFCGIPPEIKLWNEMRKIKWKATKTNVKKYIKRK